MDGLHKRASGQYELSGEMTFASVPSLWKNADWSADDAREIHLDLAKVERFDSAALALLLGWMASLEQAKRSLILLNVPPKMVEIAQVSNLDALLNLEAQR